MHSFLFHPTERNWLLGSTWNYCEDEYDDDECNINKEIYVSKNLGEDWDMIGSFVT